jgi:hypothetical protein
MMRLANYATFLVSFAGIGRKRFVGDEIHVAFNGGPR